MEIEVLWVWVWEDTPSLEATTVSSGTVSSFLWVVLCSSWLLSGTVTGRESKSSSEYDKMYEVGDMNSVLRVCYDGEYRDDIEEEVNHVTPDGYEGYE